MSDVKKRCGTAQNMKFRDVGEPLYLTPYIESGDIATAKTLSEVTDPLDGIPISEMPTESLPRMFETHSSLTMNFLLAELFGIHHGERQHLFQHVLLVLPSYCESLKEYVDCRGRGKGLGTTSCSTG